MAMPGPKIKLSNTFGRARVRTLIRKWQKYGWGQERLEPKRRSDRQHRREIAVISCSNGMRRRLTIASVKVWRRAAMILTSGLIKEEFFPRQNGHAEIFP
jgi:hypothetical protein